MKLAASNDNIHWSGQGRRPKTPDYIMWDGMQTAGLAWFEIYSPWEQRHLYVQEDCKFGGDSKILNAEGAVLAFRTYRENSKDELVEGKKIFCAALPDLIDAEDCFVHDWSDHWYWSVNDAEERLRKRIRHIQKRLASVAA